MDVEQTETLATVETLASALQRYGVTLPLVASPTDIGDVLDATGKVILTVDQHGEEADPVVSRAADLIVMATNAAAGQLVQEVG